MPPKKKSGTQPEATPQTTGTAEARFEPKLPTAQIRKSPTNRKRFNEAALQELSDNIKANGVIQPIVVRPVTPTAEQPEPYELVAGERRWRACVMAGLDDIPAMVRELSDHDAHKLQILENLQREDPHPLEEAEGYELLMQKHGYSANQLADEVKKSRSYIYGRLKLCALSTDAREAFHDGLLDASTALLVARIPTPALQVKALQEITDRTEPLSYRAAAQLIEQRFTLDLGRAVFSIKDVKLLASAGSCVQCPKRSGNQPEIYADISADVCTDPDCYEEKRAAHDAKIIVMANKKGIPIFDGDELNKALQWGGEFVTKTSPLYQFKRHVSGTYGNVGDVLKTLLPQPAAYGKRDGRLIEFYRRTEVQEALEQAGHCRTEEAEEQEQQQRSAVLPARPVKTPEQLAEEQQEQEAARKADFESRFSAYLNLRTHIASHGMSLASLREFAKLSVKEWESVSSGPIALWKHTHGLETRDLVGAMCSHIETADMPQIQLVLMDLVFGSALEYYEDDDLNAVVAVVETMSANESVPQPVADIPMNIPDGNLGTTPEPGHVAPALAPEPDQRSEEMAEDDGTAHVTSPPADAVTLPKKTKGSKVAKPGLEPGAAWPFPKSPAQPAVEASTTASTEA